VTRLRRPMAAIVLCCAISGAISASAASNEDRTLYIVGGDLHVGNGETVDQAVIELRDGKIASVRGPDAQTDLPTGARVVDATGKWITPGLIAAGSNIGLVEIDAVKSARATTRDDDEPIRASYDPSPAIRADSSTFPVQAVAGVTTAAVHPRGGVVSGQVTWIDLTRGASAKPVVKRRIAIAGKLNREVGGSRAATLGLLGRVLSDATYLRAHRTRYERRELLREFAAHIRELEALAPLVAGEVPIVISANGASDILAIIALADEFRIRVAIAGGAEAWRVGPALAASDIPVLLTPRANLPRGFDSVGARLDNAALLAKAGVEIAIIETSAHDLRNLTQEAGIAVAYGLDWEAALTALTLGVARIYQMDEVTGSVETGKTANLVVWSGDPFELSSAPEHVFVRGTEVPPVSRQTLLRERYTPR
jgi:imidazolonepropionase-like amidohydrolase